MPRLILLVLIFLNSNCYGQKSIDTIKGSDNSDASWFKENKKWDKKMGLANLFKTKDSLHIRFRDGINIVDIAMNKKGKLIANTYSYLFKLNRKNKIQKVIYKKLVVSKEAALKILDTLNRLGIADFYDGCKISGYPVTVDGVTYIFEFSTGINYKSISFANPSEALKLKEGQALLSFVKYISDLLGFNKNFENLKGVLDKGKYRVMGRWIYKVLYKTGGDLL